MVSLFRQTYSRDIKTFLRFFIQRHLPAEAEQQYYIVMDHIGVAA
jgi:hypothetical protein